MKKHISPCNCDTCIKAKQKELDEQKERASDFYACCLADIVEKIKILKEANKEDNMISLEVRLQKNEAYNECINIIKL